MWTLTRLRKEAWIVLTRKTTAIHIKKCPDGISAYSVFNSERPNKIEIWVDTYTCRLDYAVVHEIFHYLLDRHLTPHFSYPVYENFIASLEKQFWSRMTIKELNKWRKAIEHLRR